MLSLSRVFLLSVLCVSAVVPSLSLPFSLPPASLPPCLYSCVFPLTSLARSAKMQNVSRFRGAEGNRISFRDIHSRFRQHGQLDVARNRAAPPSSSTPGLAKRKCCADSKRWAARVPSAWTRILVTHEHSDHSTGLAQMAREWNCPAYLTEPTHREIVKMFAAEDPENPGKESRPDRSRGIHSRGRALRNRRHRNQSLRDPARCRRSGRLRLPHQRHEGRASSPTSATCPSS